MWIAFGIVAAAFFGVTAVGGVVASRVMANRGVRQAKKEYKTAKKELKRVEKLQKRVNKLAPKVSTKTEVERPVVKTLKQTKQEMYKNLVSAKLNPIHDAVFEMVGKNPNNPDVASMRKTLDAYFADVGAMIEDDTVSAEDFEKKASEGFANVEKQYNELQSKLANPAVEETEVDEEKVETVGKDVAKVVATPTKKELKQQAKELKNEKQKIYDELVEKYNLEFIRFEVNTSGRSKDNIKRTNKIIDKTLRGIQSNIRNGEMNVEAFAKYAKDKFDLIVSCKESLRNNSELLEELRKQVEEKNKEQEKKNAEIDKKIAANTGSIEEINKTLKNIVGEFGKMISAIESNTVQIAKNAKRSKQNVADIKKLRTESVKKIKKLQNAVNEKFAKTNKTVKENHNILVEAISELTDSLDYLYVDELGNLKEQINKLMSVDQTNTVKYEELIKNIDQKIETQNKAIAEQNKKIGETQTKLSETTKIAKEAKSDVEALRSRFKQKYKVLVDLVNSKADSQEFIKQKQSVYKQVRKLQEKYEQLEKTNKVEALKVKEELAFLKGVIDGVSTAMDEKISNLSTNLDELAKQAGTSIKKEQLEELENSLKKILDEKVSTKELLELEKKLNSLEGTIVNKFKGELADIVKAELADSKSAVRVAISEQINTRIDQRFYKNKNYKKMKEIVDNHANLKVEIHNAIMVEVVQKISEINRDLTDEEFDNLVAKVAENLIVKPATKK